MRLSSTALYASSPRRCSIAAVLQCRKGSASNINSKPGALSRLASAGICCPVMRVVWHCFFVRGVRCKTCHTLTWPVPVRPPGKGRHLVSWQPLVPPSFPRRLLFHRCSRLPWLSELPQSAFAVGEYTPGRPLDTHAEKLASLCRSSVSSAAPPKPLSPGFCIERNEHCCEAGAAGQHRAWCSIHTFVPSGIGGTGGFERLFGVMTLVFCPTLFGERL